jgi:isopentenyldiphosphate isomerase
LMISFFVFHFSAAVKSINIEFPSMEADKLSEMLDYFDADGRLLGTALRKEVHARRLINRHTAFLVFQGGKLILQKRSSSKLENAGLFDKPGGHVPAGQDFSPTEFLEEVCHGVDASACVVPLGELTFSRVGRNVAVLSELEFMMNFESFRVGREENWLEPAHVMLYTGHYEGELHGQPGEVDEVKTFSLDEIDNNPDIFTLDLLFVIEKHREFLEGMFGSPSLVP